MQFYLVHLALSLPISSARGHWLSFYFFVVSFALVTGSQNLPLSSSSGSDHGRGALNWARLFVYHPVHLASTIPRGIHVHLPLICIETLLSFVRLGIFVVRLTRAQTSLTAKRAIAARARSFAQIHTKVHTSVSLRTVVHRAHRILPWAPRLSVATTVALSGFSHHTLHHKAGN